MGRFELYVETAYFAGVDPDSTPPADIIITIDNKEVVNDTFSYLPKRHTPKRFSINLSEGPHKLVCMTTKDKTKFERDFQVQKGIQSAIVRFEYYIDDTVGSSREVLTRFSVHFLDHRPYFE